MSRSLVILNDSPYGTERSHNGLRLAAALVHREGQELRIFLLGDATACAKAGQKVPAGNYNLEHLLADIARHGCEIAASGTCLDARGITDDQLARGTHRASVGQLAHWVTWAERVLVF